jgi:hypothetical protein
MNRRDFLKPGDEVFAEGIYKPERTFRRLLRKFGLIRRPPAPLIMTVCVNEIAGGLVLVSNDNIPVLAINGR